MIELLIGIVVGLIIAAVATIWVARKNMVVNYKINGSFEQVTKAIEEVIPSFPGWGFPIKSWEFYKSQLSKDLTYDNISNMVMYFVCKPEHANSVLSVEPKMGGIMPCTWAVYETTDGDVYIAKMNIGLMSKLFAGVTGTVMKDVAQTEEAMLSKIREKTSS